jgi:hypothetical protein
MRGLRRDREEEKCFDGEIEKKFGKCTFWERNRVEMRVWRKLF